MNMAKLVCGFLVVSLAMAIAAECLVCTSKKFNCVERGMRFTGGVIMQILQISLLECAVECSRNANCISFQFTSPSSQSEGTCFFLDHYEESQTTSDLTSSIYQLDSGSVMAKPTDIPTSSSPTTTTTPTTTTPTTTTPTTTTTKTTATTTPSTTSIKKGSQTTTPSPDSRDPEFVCNYPTANEPVNVICNCTTSDFCSGILQCSANISGSAVSYYLDRTTVANYSVAGQRCKQLNMAMITVQSKEEQSTICLILAIAVGNQAAESFWLGLTRTDDSVNIGTSDWVYSDGSSLGSFSSWYMLDVFSGLCATLAGGSSSNFTWDPYSCSATSSSYKKMRTLCTRADAL